MRRAAIYALYNAGGPKPGDLDLILKLVDDEAPEVVMSSTHAIHMFTKGELFGPAAEAVLRVLDTEDERQLREGMRGIWGAKSSPELQARLIEISKLPRSRYDAIYFALSTMNNKSEAVVDVQLSDFFQPFQATSRLPRSQLQVTGALQRHQVEASKCHGFHHTDAEAF